jgi:hypothetical protein
MRMLYASAGLGLLVCSLSGMVHAETACSQPVEAALRSRGALNIDSRSGGLEIVGTDQTVMHVTCTINNVEQADEIRIKVSGSEDNRTLAITGGSSNGNFQVRIEVPRKTSLKVKMPAGQVKVEEIVGDKDIDLYAGQISISSARLWDYRKVHASVDIGQVDAQVYGTEKGGFFRTFTKESPEGEYTLHAHVMTGQIELLSTHAPAAPE